MFVLLQFLFIASVALVTSATSFSNADQAREYLISHGYLSPEKTSKLAVNSFQDQELFTQAIQDFQSDSGIGITGVLDEETLRVMNLPRCGWKDPSNTRGRAMESRWIINLTYKISTYTNRSDKRVADKAIKDAFNEWERISPITFTQKKDGPVNIDISFVRDWIETTGADMGVLAHATSPNNEKGSYIEYNDDLDDWNNHESIYVVALHEIGHTLGLHHSQHKESVMNGFRKIGRDDVDTIQCIYGHRYPADYCNFVEL